MATPVTRPSIAQQVAALIARVARLERATPVDVLSPAPVGGASTPSATPVGLWAAMATGVGGAQTWTVIVKVTGGATGMVRLRDSGSLVGATTTVTTDGTVTVRLGMTGWPRGETRMVWLDAWTTTGGTVSVWPVRAVGA